jgi:hypothetical protein
MTRDTELRFEDGVLENRYILFQEPGKISVGDYLRFTQRLDPVMIEVHMTCDGIGIFESVPDNGIDYSRLKRPGGLNINRTEGEEFYFFVMGLVGLEEGARITSTKRHGRAVESIVRAPRNIKILRNEHFQSTGLPQLIREIKSGEYI